MIVNCLLLLILAGAVAISISRELDKRDKLVQPVFRTIFFVELFLYLATAVMLLVIAGEFFGPYTHWVLPLFAMIAPRFVRMGYPDFLKFWREGDPVSASR